MGQLALAVTLLTVLSAGPALALDPVQPPYRYGRTTWGVEDGLAFGTIHALAQDHDGYLWLGTDDGLIRFDGSEFVRWPQTSIGTRRVLVLLVDRDGGMWIGGRGLRRMVDGKITTSADPDGLTARAVAALVEAPDGDIWAGGADGAMKFHDGRWQDALASSQLATTPVSRLFVDPRGSIWLATPLGTFRRQPGASEFERVTSYSVNAINADAEGNVWMADVRHGVRRVAAPAATIGRFAGEQGIKLLRDRDENLWIGTPSKGVWRLSSRDRSRAGPLTGLGPATAFSGVGAMLEDRDGNIWIAAGSVLTRLSDSDVTMIGEREGLPGTDIAAVAVTSDRRIWAATSQGLFSVRADPAGGFRARREMRGAISALHVDRHDRLWLATVYRHIGRYEIGTFERGRFVPVPLPAGALLAPVSAITVDSEQALWMCDQSQGVVRWRHGQLDRFDKISDLGRVTCKSVQEDDSHRRWFGLSTGGVAFYRDGQFHTFHDGKEGGGFALGEPVTVYVAPGGSIWLGTRRQLARFVNQRIVPVPRVADLPTPITSDLVEDADGNLWTGGHRGILRIAIGAANTAPAFRLFDEGHGLIGGVGNHLGGPNAVRSPDGSLWFATSRGLAMIDPARLRPANGADRARIDSVQADGQPVLGSPIEVPPRSTKLEIHYGALNLSAPESMRFRYRLDGVDADWINAETRREAFYTNLAPRAYTFVVDVTDKDGRWNGISTQVAVHVQPRFQQTLWFYALVSGLGAVAVVGAWGLRLRAVKGRFASILAERARVAREIHDTLLQSLGSVAIELEAVTEELPGAPPESIATLKDLRRRVTASVRETRDSIERLRAVRPENRTLLDCLVALSASCDAHGATACTLEVVGRYQSCPPLAEQHLLRIVQEAVSNARRHGRARQVRIELEYHADSLLLCVSDDGSGFDASDAASAEVTGHWGIASMRERAAIVGASFYIESRIGQGTQVQVVAPLTTS